jgi:UDP-N-acetylmuramoyl-L-alanyl-D-glutamate--2,6-diaminopimelate ligase
MVAAGCTHALVEVSSEALSLAAFAGVEFDTALITNVTDAHLRLHNSVQSYRNLKKRILDHLSPTGLAVFNADDPVSSTWLTHWDGPVITIGTKGQAEITGTLISQYSNEQVFTITAGSETVTVRTPMLGEHHLSNCLAAAAVALTHGIDLQLIAAGIETVEGLPGRMERVDCGQGFPLFVDAADTADSLRVCLRTARQMCDGRVICVLGEPNQATYSEQVAVAHVVNRLAHVVITARELPTEECNYRDSRHRTLIETVDDRYEAIARAIELACPGDVVVIAGSRHEPQRAFGMIGGEESRGDAATARLLLYARTQLTPLRIVA